MLKFLLRLLTDKQVMRGYAKRGEHFGYLVGIIPTADWAVGFERHFRKWQAWETEYLCRGYRALSVDAFVKAGYWDHELQGLGTRRDPGEEPVSHAAIYKRKYIDKKPSALTSVRQDGEVTIGTYIPHTTEVE